MIKFNFTENLLMAFRSIWGNKSRALLTMLGVLIGVGAVVALVALGRGAQNSVSSRLETLGSNLLVVNSGESRGNSLVRRPGPGSSPVLTTADLEFVAGLDGVTAVAPESGTNGQGKYRNKNTFVSLTGVTEAYPSVRNLTLASGDFLTAADNQARRRVAVIGSQTATDLFGTDNPLGKKVRFRNQSYDVIGVLQAKGGFANDNSAYIPLRTFQRYNSGTVKVASLNIQAANADIMKDLQTRIETGLLTLHKMTDLDNADFSVANQKDIMATLEATTATFTWLLGGIAGISLLVGGIGIMNIMLVSVTERTREIGIRMAVGATSRDILLQFLTESIVLSGLGGLAGVGLGLLGASLISALSGTATAVTWESIALALSVSLATGLFFGGWPAWKASKLDPIEALRYE